MPTIKIARFFHWEMGHRLPFHTGGCRNIHGHSYRMWVELEGETDAHGMVMDFADLKTLVEPIIEPFDHCFLCDTGDEIMMAFLKESGFKSVILPFESTAENLANYLMTRIWNEIDSIPRISRLRIRLHESENSYAEVLCKRP